MSASETSPAAQLLRCLCSVPDPRSRRGVSHPFHTIIAVVILGMLAGISTIAEIKRWSALHKEELEPFLRFRKTGVPTDHTIAGVLQRISVADLQNAFSQFLNSILQSTSIVAAVDGKVAKQMKDENGNPILMLNVFAQTVKTCLASWSVSGDKTNEPACLKKHLEELLRLYPALQILTGDAVYAQRPLLEAIYQYHRDYIFQVKSNNKKTLEQLQLIFENAKQREPDDRKVNKKRASQRYAVCG